MLFINFYWKSLCPPFLSLCPSKTFSCWMCNLILLFIWTHIYLLLNYLAGSQNPWALLSKQSWWCVGSYTSWNSFFYGFLIPYAENSSERAAGTAEGRGLTPGKPLWHGHDQGLCRKGISVWQFQKFMNNNQPVLSHTDGRLLLVTQ